DTLRPRLVAGVVDVVANNRRHGRRDVRVFEIGTRFTTEGETRALAMAWTGIGSGEHWSGSTREMDFFDAKGAVESVCSALGVNAAFAGRVVEPFLVAGQSASIASGDVPLGSVGQLLPAVADQRGLP